MNRLWLLLALIPWVQSLNSSSYTRCLDIPEVSPKKYFYANGSSLEIRIEMSDRVTHQLATYVFFYFIHEVVGYTNVRVVKYNDNFDFEETIRRVTDVREEVPKGHKMAEANATINLEVWISPESDTYATDFVKECGSLSPPGRFGWFIPLNLTGPIKQYYNPNMESDIRTIHWRYFRNREFVKFFHVNDTILRGVLKIGFNDGNITNVCPDEEGCVNSIFVPTQCKDNAICALLFTSDYQSLKFVKEHIVENRLFVKVIFLGDHLKTILNYLTTTHYKSRQDKSLVILSWTPSDVILYEENFVTVSFENSETMNFTHSSGYKYEMQRLVKVAWDKVEKYAPQLYNNLRAFSFNEKDYLGLLGLYDRNRSGVLPEIACQWMKENEDTWLHVWKQTKKNSIYIGGIFPMTGSSYQGKGIARASMMAILALNKNSTILPEYEFSMLASDGMCQPDNVMKNFIDFIVDRDYHTNLVGVLGPACSDTVEPLAGVSKHYHTLIISYSAEGSSFSNREKYPYFFRTIGENMHYRHVYQDFFQIYGWKQVAALTEDGQKYTEYISLMQEDLQKNGIVFIANKKFPREREQETMTRYLEDLQAKRARIVIADVVDEVARQVMCEAYKLGMTAYDGYVWFLPVWLNETWYDTDYFNNNKNETVNCTTPEMERAIRGYFSMTHAYYAADDQMMQENITVRQWREIYEKGCAASNISVSNYAGYAYDAIWVYALALDKLAKKDPEALADLHSANTTSKLVKLIEQTDFYGVSGRIKFRGGPSRFSIINILQWYNGSTHLVGNFTPKLTDDKPEILGGELKLDKEKIKWFTPNQNAPEDGSQPEETCPIQGMADAFNVRCQTAMIILNVMVAICLGITVMGVCLYLKFKYDQKMNTTKQIMAKLGLRYDKDYAMDLEEYEVAREHVELTRKLGEGAFGTVYGGEAEVPIFGWVPVAVKTLKAGYTTEDKIDFLSEADNMKRFDHKNIVKLLGVMTKCTPLATLMEYCLYGDLKNFLLARRHLSNKNEEGSEDVTPKRLTSMALDIARGLSYLAANKYVHRDLATRNCLVNAQKMVKIGDFGMSRPMDDYECYRFTRKGMLPVRWMAPESLTAGLFTSATDVWSYGVVLYEITTFGCTPFYTKDNTEVVELVTKGTTLEVPKGVKPQLEGLMKSCWAQNAKERPSASEIVEFIANIPKLVTPGLEFPLQSIMLDEGDGLEMDRDFRKVEFIPLPDTVASAPPARSGFSFASLLQRGWSLANPAPPKTTTTTVEEPAVSIQLENYCPKEPLLGPSKSTNSLINFGKFNMQSNRRDSGCQNDDEGFGHSPANGFINSKM